MAKLKLFLENFLVYGVGGVICKIIPLVMIPIITRMLPNTEYYALGDMTNTVVSFGVAIAMLGMHNSLYRMFFEEDSITFKKEVCSTTFLFTICTSVVVCILLFFLRNTLSVYAFGNSKYYYLSIIAAITVLVTSTNNIVAAPTRMQNKRKTYLVLNTISPIIAYSITMLLLHMEYYVIALPMGMLISGIILEVVFYLINREWFGIKYYKREMLKPLLAIGLPLVPNFLIYWIFNSCDRIMIVQYLGTEAEGIYAVGSKLGHCSQLIYTAFAGGWQYFAFATMKDKNQVKTNTLIFEYLGIVSFACTTVVFVVARPVFNLLFEGAYIDGYIVAPYLFFAPLLQMLFQITCNQFLVVKKTMPNMFILAGGALLNVILNMVLIPKIGIKGAAIATLAGYAAANVVCVLVLSRMKLHIISSRFVCASIIMLVFICLWDLIISKGLLVGSGVVVIINVVLIILYRDEVSRAIIGGRRLVLERMKRK